MLLGILRLDGDGLSVLCVFLIVFGILDSGIEVVLHIELQRFACGVSKRWNILIIHYHYPRSHLHAFQFPHKCVHSAIPFYNNAKIALHAAKEGKRKRVRARKKPHFFVAFIRKNSQKCEQDGEIGGGRWIERKSQLNDYAHNVPAMLKFEI